MSLPAFLLAKSRQTDCLVWVGACNNKGYGLVSVGEGRIELAHRVAYAAVNGPIAPGLVIDHVCRVRNCINPAHLEAVTQAENNRRGRAASALRVGDTCTNGHKIPEGGLYFRPSGGTECRACRGSENHRTGERRPTNQRRAEKVMRALDAAAEGDAA